MKYSGAGAGPYYDSNVGPGFSVPVLAGVGLLAAWSLRKIRRRAVA